MVRRLKRGAGTFLALALCAVIVSFIASCGDDGGGTSSKSSSSEPSSSPSSYPILFSLQLGTGIWEMDIDGSNARELISFGGSPAASPANDKIAFGEFYNSGIWTANRDGSNRQKISNFGGTQSWSPDGTKLVFADNPTTGTDRRIWRMDSNGANQVMLSTTPGSHPQWSHTSNKIIFHGEVNSGIYVINSDGSGEQRLTDGHYPSYSHDDTKIVYIGGDWTVWIMNADGSNPVQVSTASSVNACFSPDGSKVVFEGSGGGIYIINTDGTGQQMISSNGEKPHWTQ